MKPSETLLDLMSKMDYSLELECMVCEMISVKTEAHQSQKPGVEVGVNGWPDALWWSVLFDRTDLRLLSRLPNEYHASEDPLQEFLGWLQKKRYVKKTRIPGTRMVCPLDFATILSVIAMLERDISLSMSAEPGEGDILFQDSCLDHSHLDLLHQAIADLKRGMGYDI